MSIASTAAPPKATATTQETAKHLRIHYDTLCRLRRLGKQGPFRQGRDFIFIGIGTKKLLWDKSEALRSLWAFKQEPAAEVETFGRDPSPVTH